MTSALKIIITNTPTESPWIHLTAAIIGASLGVAIVVVLFIVIL